MSKPTERVRYSVTVPPGSSVAKVAIEQNGHLDVVWLSPGQTWTAFLNDAPQRKSIRQRRKPKPKARRDRRKARHQQRSAE
jgi:hypothetical protein